MNERRKLFRPSIVAVTLVYIAFLMYSFYTSVYDGEFYIRNTVLDIYDYSMPTEGPAQWLSSYRDEVFARIDELQMEYTIAYDPNDEAQIMADISAGLQQNGQFGKLGDEMLALRHCIGRYSHIDNLPTAWEEEALRAKREAKHLGLPNPNKIEKYNKLTLPEYGNYKPYEDMILWNMRSGWLLPVLFLGVCSWFITMEYSTRMYILIRVQAVRLRKVITDKLLYLLLFCACFVTLEFVLEFAISVYMAGSIKEVLQPVQALYCMGLCTVGFRIWQVILGQYIAMLCLCVFLIGFSSIISTFVHNTIGVIVIGLCVVGGIEAAAKLLPGITMIGVTDFISMVNMVQDTYIPFAAVCVSLAVIGILFALWSSYRFARRHADVQV